MANKKTNDQKYIVMDVVFHASSLNYDWGAGNYQELKKITKWDGRQYVMVSRYALRYSILHWGNRLYPDNWKLAGSQELHTDNKDVVRLKAESEVGEKKYSEFLTEIFENFPEFDLFGFMVAEKGKNSSALTRTSPVKISHAISLTPTDIDAHTMANLDITKRAGGTGSNPVTIEEKTDFYVYNITIDVNRIGKYLRSEHGNENIGDINIDEEKAKNRVAELIDIILNMKRDIKGRREDLSPWFVVVGKYESGKYESYMDKIRLDRKTHYKVKRTHKKEGDTEIIENEIEEGLMPFFYIDANEIDETANNILVYYRKNFCSYSPKKFTEVESKKAILTEIKHFLGIKESNKKNQ